jgi:S1-C subfamily serine protease
LTAIAFLILLISATARASALSDLFERSKSAVVFIYVALPDGAASGSGFVFRSDDQTSTIVTANHVVEGAQSIDVILDSNTKKRYRATVIARDRVRDVAILQIPVGHRHSLLLMDSSQVQEGNDIAVVGYPRSTLIYEQLGDSLRPEIHKGIVDAIRLSGEIVQFDAVIDHGNSGGPVIDVTTGAVVGIVRGALLDQSFLAQGLEQTLPGSGYAMSGTTIETVLHSGSSQGAVATVGSEESTGSADHSGPTQIGEPASSSAFRVGYGAPVYSDPLAQAVNASLLGRLTSYFASDNSFYMVPIQLESVTNAIDFTNGWIVDSEQLYSFCQTDRLNAIMVPIVWWNLTGGYQPNLYGGYYSGNAQTSVALYVADCSGIPYFSETKSKSENRYFVNHPADREITDMANDLINKLEGDFSTYRTSDGPAWQSLLKDGIGIDPADDKYHALYAIAPDKGGTWRVTAVFPGGPADRVGLKPHDIIVSIAGVAVAGKSLADLQPLFNQSSYTVDVQRPGGQVQVVVHPVKYAALLSMIRQ